MSLYTFISNKDWMNSFITVNKFIVTSTVLAISFVLLLGPTSMTMNVFATTNTANQGIGQSQSSTQLGVCVSGTGTLVSCNNLSAQNQANTGNNAAAQSGGNDDDDDDDGNTANQGIGQAQSSNQNALCVSGTGTFVSCNNLNAQNQQNTGSNALAQQGGSGSGGNLANQAIGQSQSSNQGSGVVSGGNTAGSGNNANTQTQNNTGSNAAAQQGGSGSGGNTANQGIGQSQSSNQGSGVVSGGNTAGSGNNANTQTQNNTGSNAVGQQ
jgi:hypothetical protein